LHIASKTGEEESMENPTRTRRFEFKACLGRGGFGEVYRATMVNSGGLRTEVAIKLLRSDIGLGDEAIARLRDEGQLLAMLRHPAILKVVDLTALDARVGLITEFIEGEDLHRSVRHPIDPIPLRPLLEVIGQVAEALHAAYGTIVNDRPLRLVHRDIKPSNIRITTHGQTKLLDFGVAFSADTDRHAQTLTNTALGSLAYMAPERFKRTRPGPAADVYALGCSLWEGLVHERLFAAPTAVEMFARAAVPEDHDQFISSRFAALPIDLPPAVGVLLGDMLAYDEDVRPTAQAIAERCEALAEALDGPTTRRWMRQHDCRPPRSRRGTLQGLTLSDGVEEAAPSTDQDPAHGNGSASTIPSTLPPLASHEPRLRPRVPATMPPAELDRVEQAVTPETGKVHLVVLAGVGLAMASAIMTAGLLWFFPVGGDEPRATEAIPLEMGVEFAPEQPATGRVVVEGGVDVELRSGEDVFGPGELPAGSYEVYVDFGFVMTYVWNLTVLADQTSVLTCSTRERTCKKQRAQ
jgi:serine/threonine protein kinase